MRGPATPRRAGPKSLSRTRVSLALALVAARLAHTPLTQPGAVRPADSQHSHSQCLAAPGPVPLTSGLTPEGAENALGKRPREGPTAR